MEDWKTIRIPEEDFERHNEKRREMGCTWAEYIDGASQDTEPLNESTTEAIEELRQELTKRDLDIGPVELEASERYKIAQEVVEKLP